MACAPSEDADQQMLFSLRFPVANALDPKRPTDYEDSDQTVWMRRLIGIFVGCTCSLVGNAVPGSLIFSQRAEKCKITL